MELERHRRVLRSLSRRELQARAKALGLRANGKSVDIIETVAKVLSTPSSPFKPTDTDVQVQVDNSDDADDQENDKLLGDPGSRLKLAQSVGVAQPPSFPSEPCTMDCLCDIDQDSNQPSQLEAMSATVEPATSAGPVVSAGMVSTMASVAAGAGTVPGSSLALFTKTSPEDLAAGTSAAALAVSLSNFHFGSQLKSALPGSTLALLRRDIHQSPSGNSQCSLAGSPRHDMEGDDTVFPGEILKSYKSEPQQDEPTAPPQAEGWAASIGEPARRLAFMSNPLPLQVNNSKEASTNGNTLCDGGRQSPTETGNGTFEVMAELGHPNSGQMSSAGNNGGSNAPNTPLSFAPDDFNPNTSCSHNKEASSSPIQPSGSPHLTFVAASGAAVAAAGSTTPTVVKQVSGPSRPMPEFVTERTPLRQQRLLAVQVRPPGAPTATPSGRVAAVPRTPGTGIRTPARRVPVCTDEVKERAMDVWVMRNLVTPRGLSTPAEGLPWDELAGLREVKRRLKTRGITVGSSTTGSAAKENKRPRGVTEPAASGQQRAAKSNCLPNAAVLIAGPSGNGKSLLARALRSELDAAYVHVPPNLVDRLAQDPGGAEVVLRSVARVATHLPGPVVVHIEDVDRLASVEATRQSQERRRLRAELLVAVDELLLQPLIKVSSPGQGGVRSASPAASPGYATAAAHAGTGGNGSSTRPRFKVLVLTTTSRPMDLDDSLAASLGRTDRLLAAPPGPDDRERFLVRRLASVGAALDVGHVENVVRQTEGLSMAQLAALCDEAVKAAAARRASSRAGEPASLTVEDLAVAMRHLGQQDAADNMVELEQWHVRMSSMPSRWAQIGM
ncbi:hypothetical protein VOLCADRAFT_92777 [Volvox carteri f. nagariensis]|uniref:SAP domain-containing protein n=1 Tax=Volvox carteri f. nagariensis TaxID=3068 RepID=D8U0X9_VOLCA|nr:uncharacterized protein VOLCADRAFT_92777 [Volvox carteri f. nagariensis]EFJ46627.1 hypothetical protein VOLCADRAFT_92777 [Volvox carteri f. nagariensis]|eukprot:XP_002952156.1 hypothetical protein VOLCADRAFT_92777 [Volvox carteri f. nagariensis]